MATKIKLNDCVPCIAIHPGEIIKDELDAREMKQKELASLMSMPTSVLNDIIKGRRAVTPEVAVLLQEILGIDASYWLSLQNQYDIDRANINKKIVERKKNIEIWKVISQYCSVKYFEKLNVIGTKISENIKIIYSIFGVTSVEELIASFSSEKELSYFKKSERLKSDPINIFSWKHFAFYQSSQMLDVADFDENSLERLVQELNQMFVVNINSPGWRTAWSGWTSAPWGRAPWPPPPTRWTGSRRPRPWASKSPPTTPWTRCPTGITPSSCSPLCPS